MGNVVSCLGSGDRSPSNIGQDDGSVKTAVCASLPQAAQQQPVKTSAIADTHDASPSSEPASTDLQPQEAPAKGFPHQVALLGPPLPPCEGERQATLHALDLHGYSLESPPDPEIEAILKLVTSIFQVPNALVALFDDRRIFIRESTGSFKRGDFPWRYSFCGWTLATPQDTIMVIPDATKDARFCDNPNVTTYGVRCYVGAPLVASNGHRLGTLCFTDTKPRDMDANQTTILANFAEMVVRQVEKDIALQLRSKDNARLTHAYRNLKRAIDALDSCVVLLDTTQPGWSILYTNPAWEKLTGCCRNAVLGHTLGEVMELAQAGASQATLPSPTHCELAEAGKEMVVDNVRVRAAWLMDPTHPAGGSDKGMAGHNPLSARGPLSSAMNLSDRSSSVTTRSATSSSSSSRRLVLKLRPAAGAALDAEAVSLAVPSWVANKANPDIGHGIFFMTVESREAAAAAYARSLLSANSSASLPMCPVAGLHLGKLLGTGSFGTVYAGTWYGTPVAIKVINQDMRSLEKQGMQMEALLGVELRHPHIVSTLTYATYVPNKEDRYSFSDDSARPSVGDLAPLEHGNTGLPRLEESPPMLCQDPSAAVPPPLAALTPPTPALIDAHLTPRNNGIVPQASMPLPAAVATAAAGAPSAAYPIIELDPSQPAMSAWTTDGRMSGGFNGLSAPGTLSGSHVNMPRKLQQTFIVLEYCDKGSLQDAVDRGWLRTHPALGTARLSAVVATACEIASALLYLHSHGIVHGDLSAWNVLLTTAGAGAQQAGRGFTAKIADFGMSRALDIKTRVQTRTYGTITHQPPETLVDGIVSRETDTFSLGVLLWQMYTGSRPWAGLSHAQIIMSVASRSARLQFPSDTPADYAALAHACLSYDARQRPAMADVCAALSVMKDKYCTEAGGERADLSSGAIHA